MNLNDKLFQINTWRDPYDAGFTPTKPKQVSFIPGLTVLVGCNGAGKTTLLNNIEAECGKDKIPCHKYNNLSRDNSYGAFLGLAFSGLDSSHYEDNLNTGMLMLGSSEGECIKVNLNNQYRKYTEFAETGKIKTHADVFADIFRDDDEEDDEIADSRRVLLFDAVDSGMSIDAIVEVKSFFKKVIHDYAEKGLTTYIITVANEYEMASGENCFDVNAGKYLNFTSYEDYKQFVLRSRDAKDKRIEKQLQWQAKQEQKEIKGYEKLKEKVEARRQKYLDELKAKHIEPWKYDYTLRDFDRQLDDYIRNCRFADIKDDTRKE